MKTGRVFLNCAGLLLAGLPAGCGRPTPEVPASAPPLPAAAETVEPPPRARQLTVRYKGMNAAEWAERLHDRDVETSRLAGLALSQIGEESVPFLLAGMDSPNVTVRLHSVGAFPPASARAHAGELTPRLRRFLNDEWHAMRHSAAWAASNLPEMLPDLEAAYLRETVPEFRNSVALALEACRKLQTPK